MDGPGVSRIVEGEYISKGFVFKVLIVELDQILIRAKNIIQGMELSPFLLYDMFNPGSGIAGPGQMKIYPFRKKTDGH